MRKRLVLLAALTLVLVLASAVAGAQSSVLQVTFNPRYGMILTDGEGYSLYVYTQDTVGEDGSISNCTGVCTRNWPPLLAEGEVVAGEGVNPALIGTIVRDDGTVQVTYNGWPLYRSSRDSQPGDIRGQRLGNAFFLLSPSGEPVREELPATAQVDPQKMNQLMELGRQVFARNCAVCHGDQGQGGIGPAFAGNSALARNDMVIPMILDGFPDHGMPAWRNRLTDEEIAAVATFIRNSWGNAFGPIVEEQVAEAR